LVAAEACRENHRVALVLVVHVGGHPIWRKS
jgi:hypothetical protein